MVNRKWRINLSTKENYSTIIDSYPLRWIQAIRVIRAIVFIISVIKS